MLDFLVCYLNVINYFRYDEAAKSIQKEKNMYKEIENYPTCYKVCLNSALSFWQVSSVMSSVKTSMYMYFIHTQKTIAQVLVHLHRADYVAADKCVRESYSIPGFSGSEDCLAMEQLLQGFDQQDEDQVSRVCNSPLLKYMDNDVSYLLYIL